MLCGSSVSLALWVATFRTLSSMDDILVAKSTRNRMGK